MYTPNANFVIHLQNKSRLLLSMLTPFSVVNVYGMKLWLPKLILCGKIALESILF